MQCPEAKNYHVNSHLIMHHVHCRNDTIMITTTIRVQSCVSALLVYRELRYIG